MGVGIGARTPTRSGGMWSRLGGDAAETLSTAGPPLLFGFRLWASVCLALFVAFYLELPNASWAGTTAAIMSQPQVGASLRKGWFLMLGTIVGAIMIVVLTGVFPQDRVGFLGFLTLWCGLCAYFASQLKNFASYAAALAGYTPLIIAANNLGPTGGPDAQIFMVAVTRASEICIGIVSAGIVLAGTDVGSAPRVLAKLIANLASGLAGGLMSMLELVRAKQPLPDTQPQRRELVRRIIALDPAIDQAIGESTELRYHLQILQRAICGLFASADAWRTIAGHLARLPDDDAQQQTGELLSGLPPALRPVLASGAAERWLADPARLRDECEAARLGLLSLSLDTPSQRLLADQMARFLNGMAAAVDGLALLANDLVRALRSDRPFYLSPPDRLPALVNAARAMIGFGAAALFWVVTAWPNGTLAMTFVAIAALLLSPRGDQAPAAAIGFAVGSMLAIPFAATIKFAVLPNFQTFFAFALVFALYLIPVGIGVAQTARPALSPMFTVMGFIFVFLLDPENEIAYNTLAFYNSALAIFGGCAAAALSFFLLPPLPPALRARRLLDFALADLRHIAVSPALPKHGDWEPRMYSRLAYFPDKAEPIQRAELLAALTVGTEIIRLRAMAAKLALEPELGAALASLARVDNAAAVSRFTELERRLAAVPPSAATAGEALSARAGILAITEALAQHAAYFDRPSP